jgi:hypothetical protein
MNICGTFVEHSGYENMWSVCGTSSSGQYLSFIYDEKIIEIRLCRYKKGHW